MKPFMVTQLQIAFERELMMLSPFDEVLHKQLIDYSVEKITMSGQPVFTSENEHFVDALGLAYLAMVQNFPDLTNMLKEPETATKIEFTNKSIGSASINSMFAEIENTSVNYGGISIPKHDPTERPGDRPTHFKVPLGYKKNSGFGSSGWGRRSGLGKRSDITRRSW